MVEMTERKIEAIDALMTESFPNHAIETSGKRDKEDRVQDHDCFRERK